MPPKDYLVEHAWFLLFVMAFSLAVLAFSPLSPLLYDDALYSDIAKNLLQNQCYCSNFEPQPNVLPAFPLLIAAFMSVFGGAFIKPLLVFIAVFSGLATYHLVLSLSRNKRLAGLSTALFFLTPLVVYNSMLVLTDLFFAGTVALSLWAYIRFLEKRDKTSIVLCSLLTALSIMTRFVGYVLPLLFVLYFGLERKRIGITAKQTAALILLVAVFVAPWTAYRSTIQSNELKVAGEMLSGGGYGLLTFGLESFYQSGEPANALPLTFEAAVPIQAVNLGRALISLTFFVTPLMSLFFLWFLWNRRPFGKGRYDSLFILWFVSFFMFHVLLFFYFGARYLIPFALPVVFAFARFADSRLDAKKSLAVGLVGLQLLSAAGLIYLDSQLRWSKSETAVFDEAGPWIRENTPPEATFLIIGYPSSSLSYYGERRVVGPEDNPSMVAESNLGYSGITLAGYENETGSKFTLLKEFSDDRYYARIYGKV
jgi:4-amino-4-deoxy-L-arabinose transferase-like glycosyltransferase